MNHTILTTRNTTKKWFFSKRISVAIEAGVGVLIMMWLFKKADELESVWRFSDANEVGSLAVQLGFVTLVIVVLEAAYYYMQYTSYADVYQDRIAGKGMQTLMLKDFDLRFDQIVNISQNNGFLSAGTEKNVFLEINTVGGNYKIRTTADCAREIMEFFQRTRGQSE